MLQKIYEKFQFVSIVFVKLFQKQKILADQRSIKFKTLLCFITRTREPTIGAADAGFSRTLVNRYLQAKRDLTIPEVTSYIIVSGRTAMERIERNHGDLVERKGRHPRPTVVSGPHTKQLETAASGFTVCGMRRADTTNDGRIEGNMKWVWSALINVSGVMTGPRENN